MQRRRESPKFEFIKDGTVTGLSSSELDALAAEITEKTVARNSVEYPNIDDKIMEDLEIYPELDDKIIEMMNLAEEVYCRIAFSTLLIF